MEDVRIELNTRDCVIALWEGVVLGLWRGQTTSGAIRRAAQVVTQYTAERQSPVLLLTVIEANAPLPPLEARVEMVAFLKGSNGSVERHALVFEGEGFRAASIRAVVAGVALFSRPSYPYSICGSVGAAARFLSAGRNATLAPHRVIRMVNEARRNVGTQTMLPWLMPMPQAVTEVRSR
jgi:hypothetical protein